jgi:hypothetical protein
LFTGFSHVPEVQIAAIRLQKVAGRRPVAITIKIAIPAA